MPDTTTVHISTKGKEANSYDAIVVGSGISGGWAAKELCEKGLKTLVLERGRDVQHIKDYPTATLSRWELPHRGQITQQTKTNNPLITKAAGYDESTQHFFVQDKDHPYIQEKPFDWIRGYQVGGKSLTWGRACARWSEYDFTAPRRYGYGESFPIDYNDIKDWYSHVEKFIGVCGNKDGIDSMPDGEFLTAYELNVVERHLQKVIKEKFNRHYVSGRWAHISDPQQIHLEQGRGQCMNRNLCMRGCPLGGYFSSNSSTLPWATKTGNLTIRPHSVVHSIIYDERRQCASGVRVIDAVLNPVQIEAAKETLIHSALAAKDVAELKSLARDLPARVREDLCALPRLFGGADVLDEALRVLQPTRELDHEHSDNRRQCGAWARQGAAGNDRPLMPAFAGAVTPASTGHQFWLYMRLASSTHLDLRSPLMASQRSLAAL